MSTISLDWAESGQVAVVTINNSGRRNALTYGMFRELADVWEDLDQGPARCVIVTGRQEGGAFCSGADLSQNVLNRPDDIDTLIDRALLKTTHFSKPLIAAINGHAVAGGLELVLSTDLRAVVYGARLGLPEAKRAVFPSGGGALKLHTQIGRSAAMDLLLTGRLVEAREAVSLGLVNVALPPDQMFDWCMEKARAIAANSPITTQAIKTFVTHSEAMATASLLKLEQQLVDQIRSSADAAEGRAAFVEKRMPVWSD